ncbi:hypothetical protein WJX82_011184 [Trebouxia sp. C0006]
MLVLPKIKIAANVDMVCFDKTGTLTESEPDFHGMVPVIYQAFAPLQKGAVIWPNRLRQAAAVCNSLTYLDRGITVGDAAQKTLLKVVEAHFLGRNTVVLPLPPSGKGKAKMCTLTVLRRFGFEAPLLRSGVVAVDGAAAANTAVLFVHGAPSVIEQLVSKDTLPSDYCQVIDDYSSRSFRVLAVAAGKLHGLDQVDMSSATLQQLESCCELHLIDCPE